MAFRVKPHIDAPTRLMTLLRTERWIVMTVPGTRIAGSQPGKSTAATSVVETVRLNMETS